MDRRTVWAILLMMVIAVIPAVFIKRPAPVSKPLPGAPVNGAAAGRGAGTPSGPAHTPTVTPAPQSPLPSGGQAPDSAAVKAPARIIRVISPLYHYGFSTAGGRMVTATLPRYPSMVSGEHGRAAQLMPANSDLLD